jgi:SAM-dependent methyltransferase
MTRTTDDTHGAQDGPHRHGTHGTHDAPMHDAMQAEGFAHDQSFWDDLYLSQDALWSGNPNPQLVTEVAALGLGAESEHGPRRALDVGCGEGADAIWLAERGWQVTGVDLSAVALERAAAHARTHGADVAERTTWLHADLTEEPPAESAYDLVSAHFMHLPKKERLALHQRLARSVTPGGHLLLVGHHPSDLEGAMPRPALPDLFSTASEMAATLDPAEWTVLVEESRARTVEGPDGAPVTIHDAVLRARKTRDTRKTGA